MMVRCVSSLIGRLTVVVALGVAALPVRAQAQDLLVFAAASLKTALDEIHDGFARDKGRKAIASYAASPTLVRQLEAGAPADLVISADRDWMDYAAQRSLIRPETRINLLGNAIVLVAPAASPVTLSIGPNFPLAAALGGGRLSMADPASVPAGKYGKASLEALGVWTSVAGRIAPAENVRAALLLVSRGETPLGIVYQTDAAADKGVRVVGRFPPDTHPPIVYPIAITRRSTHPAAAEYLAYLKSPAAKPAFEKQGFILMD